LQGEHKQGNELTAAEVVVLLPQQDDT